MELLTHDDFVGPVHIPSVYTSRLDLSGAVLRESVDLSGPRDAARTSKQRKLWYGWCTRAGRVRGRVSACGDADRLAALFNRLGYLAIGISQHVDSPLPADYPPNQRLLLPVVIEAKVAQGHLELLERRAFPITPQT